MKRLWPLLLLLSAMAFGQGGTTSSDFYPAVSGQNLGNPDQRWNVYAQDLDVSDTFTATAINAATVNGMANAAVLGLQAAYNTGLDVYVPAGTTLAAANITVNPGQHTECASSASSIFTIAASTTGFKTSDTTTAVAEPSWHNCQFQLEGNSSVGIDALCMTHLTLRDNLFTGTGGSSGQKGVYLHGGYQCSGYYARIQNNRFGDGSISGGIKGNAIDVEDGANEVNISFNKFSAGTTHIYVDGGTCYGNSGSSCPYGTIGTSSGVNTTHIYANSFESSTSNAISLGNGGNPGAVTYSPRLWDNRFEGNYRDISASNQVNTLDSRGNFESGPTNTNIDNSLDPVKMNARAFSGGAISNAVFYSPQDYNIVSDSINYNSSFRVTSNITGTTFSGGASYPAINVIVTPGTPNNHYYKLTGYVADTGVCGADPGTWPTDGSTVTIGDCKFQDIGQNSGSGAFVLATAAAGDIGSLKNFTSGVWGLYPGTSTTAALSITTSDVSLNSFGSGAIFLNAKNAATGTGGVFFGDGAVNKKAWINSTGQFYNNCQGNLTLCFIFTGTPTTTKTVTFPDNTGTVAELNLAESFTAVQTFTSQIVSSLATGTPPLAVTSTTPVPNLAAAPIVYDHSGTQLATTHMVADVCTLGTSCSVTLVGSAIFTSSASYQCTATDKTAAAAVKFVPSSGSAFALTGTGTDVLSYVCVGN